MAINKRKNGINIFPYFLDGALDSHSASGEDRIHPLQAFDIQRRQTRELPHWKVNFSFPPITSSNISWNGWSNPLSEGLEPSMKFFLSRCTAAGHFLLI